MPSEERVILETSSLQLLVEKHSKCPVCQGKMQLKFHTLTLATQAYFECKSKQCDFKDMQNDPAGTNLPQFADDNYTRCWSE